MGNVEREPNLGSRDISSTPAGLLVHICISLSCLMTCLTLIKSVRGGISSISILSRLIVVLVPAQALVEIVFEGMARCGAERIASRRAGNERPNQVRWVFSHPFLEDCPEDPEVEGEIPFSTSLWPWSEILEAWYKSCLWVC